ncbi:MAG: MG2 domain-containing protein [Cardiobacteriaceae bacterium]|nr:MG2 domain-containing protein [Cardiobacteriaceae bacterium]
MKNVFSLLLLAAMPAAFAQSFLSFMLEDAERELDKHPERAVEVFARLEEVQAALTDGEQRRLDWLYRRFGFAFDDIDVERDQDKPDICLVFNRAVRPQPMQEWAARISLTPAPPEALRYLDDRLCFFGEWAQTYQLKIDAALESDNHMTLEAPIAREIATGNRDPMLRFAVQGHVLALAGDQQIALESSNVRKVRLQLWHFPREALANDTLRSALHDPQNYWADFKSNDWMRERARNVFSGSFAVADNGRNAIDASHVRFADMLGDTPADPHGFYLLNAWAEEEGASADDYYRNDDSQTLAFTLASAGLSAYRTEEGLWVEARDLANTNTLKNIDITLYAKSGARIASVKSDAKGMAHFTRAQITGKDGDAPAYLIAEGEQGMTWLDLDGSGFDLADKGLQGDPALGSLRTWSWVDRGVYRPGEPMHVLWLVKNRDLSPFAAPLWLTLERPDGIVLESRAVQPDASGAYRFDHDFAGDAALGNWHVSLRLGRDGEIISREAVRVDSILPQTLEASVSRPAPPRFGDSIRYALKADWLYGAPAANIRVESAYRIAAADLGLPDWQGWQIGRHDEDLPAVTLAPTDAPAATNAQGESAIPLNLPESHATRPQNLHLSATLTPEGGRPLSVRHDERIHRAAPYAALKAEGRNVQAALLDDSGALQSGALDWTLYRLDYHYYWYRSGEQWQIRENVTRAELENGKVALDGKAPATIALPWLNDYDPYLLDIRGQNAQSAASLALGYRPQGNGSAPDRIRFARNDHPPYRAGDTVTLRLYAPFDGAGSVHLASDAILDTLPVTFKDGSADIRFTWQSGWDSGLWLLASGYNADQSGARNRRAVGLEWLAADSSAHRLALNADIPENIEPGQPFTLTFSGEGFVNVAIIDDGLYQLGRATFADPLAAFFGKKRLPLALFDVWGSVIRQLGGDAVALRSGAGDGEEALSAALADLPDIDMRDFIRYWSGPIALQDGKASVTLDIPQGFNGRLRVMAANYADKRFGHLEQTLTVRAPLVTELRTPAYLSVNDRGEFVLRLHNTTDSEQHIRVAFSADHLQLEQPERQLTLGAQQAENLILPFRAETAGNATLRAHIDSGERQYPLERTLTIRSATLPYYTTRYDMLKGGESRTAQFAARSILTPAAYLPWSAEALGEDLRRYPYSCNEQLTSRLVILGEDAKRFPDDADKQAQFRDPYNTLLNRQQRSGGFGLWRGSRDDLWLSAYIGETLLAHGGEPPYARSSPQARLLNYLKNAVLDHRDSSVHSDDIAYAHLLLARSGIDLRGALLNHSERLPQTLPLTPASLNLALAFAAYGDGERATALIKRIDPSLAAAPDNHYSGTVSQDGELLVRLHQWQSAMPDQAALVHGWQDTLIQRIGQHDKRYLSTQAQSWLLRAALLHPKAEKALTLDGQPLTARQTLANTASITLENPDNAPQYLAISELHYPGVDDSTSQGWTLALRHENFAGDTRDPATMPLHENRLIHVELTRNYHGNSDIILTCPLPAGILAENATPEHDPLAAFAENEWHQQLTVPEMAENRDDRHIAAFRLNGDDTTIRHAFAIKAARVGEWHAPGCQVEDMYRPEHHARDKAQRLSITAP